MSGTSKAKKAVRVRPPVRFTPMLNGVDYLESVVDNLTYKRPRAKTVNPRPEHLKYAVLHLQAATEVLLKARLAHEHWSLVFKDLAKADRAKLETGDFISCGLDETIVRLKGIAGIDVGLAAKTAYRELADSRNALQHYGLTTPAEAIEARAALVLDCLLDFIDQHMVPVREAMDDDDRFTVLFGLDRVREAMTEIREFVKVRMDRLLNAELRGLKSSTVQCPACEQWALIIDGRTPRCLLCTREWEADDGLPSWYASATLGITWRRADPDPFEACPQCGEEALIACALLADAPGKPRRLCFHCGFQDRNLTV